MNKVIISGNLTRDPEIRYTQSGKAVARLGIAVQRRFKSQDSSQPDVDFFNMTAWDKTAEFCGRYLTKGTRVVVEGRMQNYSYDAQDGTKRTGMEIQVENIEFGGNKRDSEGGDRPAYNNAPPAPNFEENTSRVRHNDNFVGEPISEDDVPF